MSAPNVVDRVVICDAFAEPNEHYQLLLDGNTKRVQRRRPSLTIKADTKAIKGGIAAARANAKPTVIEQEMVEQIENPQINIWRSEVKQWREEGYPGTAKVTRSLLAWWFERSEERHTEKKRFFFCQQEAIETLIYIYEVKRHPMLPETDGLLRYALKLATGTGKTVVMAMAMTWSTLHKAKVSGSSLSGNFLVLTPNLTVRDRVSGDTRGDGLVPNGVTDLYATMDIVPPEYTDAFKPNVMVKNWQSVQLEIERDDWIAEKHLAGDRFVPYGVQKALERRRRRDPVAGVRRLLKGWRDVIVINDEAHHVYGEKAARAGEEPAYIRWNKIMHAVESVTNLALVIDLSATPWYGSGSPKDQGTLFEWLISDFSVYDAFESGLVKIVRLPDPASSAAKFIDIWDRFNSKMPKDDYLGVADDAIATMYAAWSEDFGDWEASFEVFRGPQPVLLVVADTAQRAQWLFEHLTGSYPLLGNDDPDDAASWVTIRVDSKIFDAEKGREGVLRAMVSTVGKPDKPGARVRCIVSVNMLSEGWDVNAVTHILGFRAFGSPLLTEQIIGRGLRRLSYDVLYEPLDARKEGSEETVDSFGIPFVGFPVQKSRTRHRKADKGHTPIPIKPEYAKRRFRIQMPNVRSWAPGVTEPLSALIDVKALPGVKIDPASLPSVVDMVPVIGAEPNTTITRTELHAQFPMNMIAMAVAGELLKRTSSDGPDGLGVGPTFEELLDLSRAYLESRVETIGDADPRDAWIHRYRSRVLDVLENAIAGTGSPAGGHVPMPGDPPELDTATTIKEFRWIADRAAGLKCHLGAVPCHSELEVAFADFLDSADDVDRYIKNEHFGFAITYLEGGRARHYYPDFVIAITSDGGSQHWVVAETKGEVWANTDLKSLAARQWCERMTATGPESWEFLFVPQVPFEKSVKKGATLLSEVIKELRAREARQAGTRLTLIAPDPDVDAASRFTTHLPVYSLEAAAGHFGTGREVQLEGWIPVDGRLNDRLFVARVVGKSMEPRVPDGSLCVFEARPVGSRQNKIVIVQHHDIADPETGGAYTLKQYASEKEVDGDGEPRNVRITLRPLNAAFDPIILTPEFEHDVRVIAELKSVLQ
ncbi:MAG: DEAD/DEAH box helicase family protein [Dehalococcoidia bacterium]